MSEDEWRGTEFGRRWEDQLSCSENGAGGYLPEGRRTLDYYGIWVSGIVTVGTIGGIGILFSLLGY